MEKDSKPLIKCLFKWVGCRGFFSYFGPQLWAGVPKFSADESLEECFHQALWNLILPQAFENATPPLNIIADFRQIYAEGAAFVFRVRCEDRPEIFDAQCRNQQNEQFSVSF